MGAKASNKQQVAERFGVSLNLRDAIALIFWRL